ncbi:MAG TPA: tetrahydrofolate dehydrogenase/cyclohydrolase catalytic domain-containing protein [Bacteriovoracaceae bacterium]|nr:tetrahydrofolate dehydrogenase/cyclohydrolase catalytic domain-containing protein [Bacteriovoracaceae bacterium]
MTAIILSAKPVLDKIKNDLIKRCEALKAKQITPSMSVVLVGDNPASLSYIRNKKKLCEEIGARFTLTQLPAEVTQEQFLTTVSELNQHPQIHGVIIQLPVSEHLKKLNLPNLISPAKDIDGFHESNTQKLYAGSTDLGLLMPCTPKGIVNLLKYYQIGIEKKHVVIVGRSLIVGKPLSMLLSNFDATVTLAHSKTVNLKELTRRADILISAIGVANHFDESYFDRNKNTVVVDVGMNSLDGRLTGDVNQDSVKEVVAARTPVPGGVGPMTVISLIDNLITACENNIKG